MSAIPGAIILVNNDLTDSIQETLVRQLFIDEVYDGYEFESVIDGYGDYNGEVRRRGIRVMVIVDFSTLPLTFRAIADIAIFVKAGLANVMTNKIGPHGASFPLVRISWDQLGIHRDNRSIL